MNKNILMLIIAVLVLVMLLTPVMAEPPSGMVSYWRLDEGSGTIAYDSVGDNDGTLINGPTRITGKVDGALSFDGINDYVEVDHSTSLDFVDEITMEAWIKPISYGPSSKIIYRVGGNTYSLSVPEGKLWFYMLAGWEGHYTVYNLVSDNIPTGIWSHVAATYDGSSMKLYLNGGKVKERSATGLIHTWSGNLLIGNADAAAPIWAFNGLIDEVAIYDKALVPEEIQQHYENGLEGVGYFVEKIPATINIEPDTLNLKSNGALVTAYIKLPEDYNVADIDLSTVKLEGVVEAIQDLKYSFVTDPNEYLVDHDGDGILERMIKFDRPEVISYVNTVDFSGEIGKFKEVTLTITGEVAGTPFEGSDTIRVKI